MMNIPFIYYFITTNNHNHSDLFERDTFTYRFNRNIANHTQSRYLISHLPKGLEELVLPWPISSIIKEPVYCTDYVNVDTLIKCPLILEGVKNTPLGCVFVPEELKDHEILQMLEGIHLPVIVLEKEKEILSSCLPMIIEKNNENIKQFLSYGRISDKTKIEPISLPPEDYLSPLVIAINRNRGLYISIFDNKQVSKQSCINNEEKETLEEGAIKNIEFYMKRLIAEKYITYLAGHSKGIDLLIRLISKWDGSIGKDDLQPDVLEKYFLNLSDYFLENFENVFYLLDMCFVLPMVNKTTVEITNNAFRLRLNKKMLRRIYDFSGYFMLEEYEDDKIWNPFIDDILLENSILDSLMINFSLGGKIPYVRLPNLPSSDITSWYSNMTKSVIYNSNLSEIEKFNNILDKISEKLKLSLDNDLLELIIQKGKHIKFISDAPVEWIKYQNVPISLIKSISRLPIVPGNILVESAKKNFRIEIKKDDVSFLIINSLNKDDELYKNGEKIGKLLKSYFPSHLVSYYEVTNKDDFIQIVNESEATFFIYYGHGGMQETSRNNFEQIGKLYIGNDEINMIELAEKIEFAPLISILGACQTQVLDSHYLNIGNIFFELGSISVMATFFPVDGDYTCSLIESIFRNLKNLFEGNCPDYIRNWSDVLLQARRVHYIREPVKTINEYLNKKGNKTKINSEELLKFVWKYCIFSSTGKENSKNTVMEQAVLYRDNAYKKYFESYSEDTRNLVDYIFEHNYIFPESIVFTSLGSPENIYFI